MDIRITPDVSESGVGEVYRILHLEDGNVILENTLSHSSDEEWVVYFFPTCRRLRYEGFSLIFIRDIMLAWLLK